MIENVFKGFKWYCLSIMYLHKTLLFIILKRICEKTEPLNSCKLFNARQRLTKRSARFNYLSEISLYTVQDSGNIIYFSEKMRGFWLYADGIGKRGIDIFNSYFISDIHFDLNDIVIDCGANYGDLYIELHKREPHIQYISFEPSPREFECVKNNVPNQQHHNVALNKVSGTIDLFVSSKGGDSSLIEPVQGYTQKISINAVCLDDFAANISRIKLLKLEAEGLEPEVLEGATSTLNRIEYIAADGGAERGIKKESTIEKITNMLISTGFELLRLDISSGKGRALFRKKIET